MRTDSPYYRWLVVALCFLSQNMAMGFAFGSFGPLLVSTEAQFGISRSEATIGMSFLNLALGGLAPLLGGVMQRFPIRYTMMAGALLSALGYFCLSYLTYYPLYLAAFVMVGAGVSLGGVIGPLTLISRWFVKSRATTLSIANLPVALLLTPYIVGAILPAVGRSAVLAGAASIFLLLAPFFLLLRDHPRTSADPADLALLSRPSSPPSAALSVRQILANRSFWLLSIAMGLMAGTGIIFVVHIIAFAIGKGMAIQTASTLLSFHAGAGLVGVLLIGRIADRIGPVHALILTSFCQIALWSALLVANGSTLFALAALMGLFAVPMATLHGAALSTLIPVSSISSAMGLSYAIKLPFLSTFALVAALLFEASGSYTLAFALTAMLMALSCSLFVILALERKGRPVLAGSGMA